MNLQNSSFGQNSYISDKVVPKNLDEYIDPK